MSANGSFSSAWAGRLRLLKLILERPLALVDSIRCRVQIRKTHFFRAARPELHLKAVRPPRFLALRHVLHQSAESVHLDGALCFYRTVRNDLRILRGRDVDLMLAISLIRVSVAVNDAHLFLAGQRHIEGTAQDKRFQAVLAAIAEGNLFQTGPAARYSSM